VDRCRRILAKMSEEVYRSAAARTSPMPPPQKRRRAHALIDRANLDFRDMHEVGGLIVRRKALV